MLNENGRYEQNVVFRPPMQNVKIGIKTLKNVHEMLNTYIFIAQPLHEFHHFEIGLNVDGKFHHRHFQQVEQRR